MEERYGFWPKTFCMEKRQTRQCAEETGNEPNEQEEGFLEEVALSCRAPDQEGGVGAWRRSWAAVPRGGDGPRKPHGPPELQTHATAFCLWSLSAARAW